MACKEDGTLDEAAVTEYLEQANRIYQTGKTGIDTLKAQGFCRIFYWRKKYDV